MGMPKGRSGNPGGKPKLKPWTEALQLVANSIDTSDTEGKKHLRRLAEKTFALALEGDIQAIKEIGNRLEGTPMQAVQISGDEDAPLQVIKRVVVDPKAE